MSKATASSKPDSQAARRLKYGSNVAISSVIVIALAVLVVYLAEIRPKRFDTTASGQFSLKPRTIDLIKSNKQKIKIVSLYTRQKQQQQSTENADTPDTTTPADLDVQATAVTDLLDEYAARGSDITVESIDPNKDTTKLDDLVREMTKQYGGDVAGYSTFAADVGKLYDSVATTSGDEQKRIGDELKQVHKLPPAAFKSNGAVDALNLLEGVSDDVGAWAPMLKQTRAVYDTLLRQKPPEYQELVSVFDVTMTPFSTGLDRVITDFKKSESDPTVPETIRKFLATDIGTFIMLKTRIDGLKAREGKLGKLELNKLVADLKLHNVIMVLGQYGWRAVPYAQVWQPDTRAGRGRPGDASLRPRFSGERAVTTAILALTGPVKDGQLVVPKVCFVRAGNMPESTNGSVFSFVGDQLRQYGYDVTDKDLTGAYASFFEQQFGQPDPEPPAADIQDAVWIVDGQMGRQQNPNAPPPSIAAAVADHIAHGFHYVDGVKTPGGSAFILLPPDGETFSEALTPLGVTAETNQVVVHARVEADHESADDFYNGMRQKPYFFIVTDWGSNVITAPIRSLPGLLVVPVVLRTQPVKGITTTPLFKVPGPPTDPKCWATTDLQSMDDPVFKKGDIDGPFDAAVSCEDAKAGSRVVVMASGLSFVSGGRHGRVQRFVDMPDPEDVNNRHVDVPAFPGNAELFINSVYWLGHRESMIAMSPATPGVDRVGPMTPGTLQFWRIGILLIGIPGLAVACGLAVFFARRS